jgi:hypothetical protein
LLHQWRGEEGKLTLFDTDIQAHLAGGMAIAIIDGIDALPKIPGQYLNGNGIAS